MGRSVQAARSARFVRWVLLVRQVLQRDLWALPARSVLVVHQMARWLRGGPWRPRLSALVALWALVARWAQWGRPTQWFLPLWVLVAQSALEVRWVPADQKVPRFLVRRLDLVAL